jgi:hypothetical protein
MALLALISINKLVFPEESSATKHKQHRTNPCTAQDYLECLASRSFIKLSFSISKWRRCSRRVLTILVTTRDIPKSSTANLTKFSSSALPQTKT